MLMTIISLQHPMLSGIISIGVYLSWLRFCQQYNYTTIMILECNSTLEVTNVCDLPDQAVVTYKLVFIAQLLFDHHNINDYFYPYISSVNMGISMQVSRVSYNSYLLFI